MGGALIHKLGVVRTLYHRASYIPSSQEARKKEEKHLRQALGSCGYRQWSIQKALHPRKRNPETTDSTETRKSGVCIPYVKGLSEKVQRVFHKYKIPVYHKPVNTIRQKLVHPKDKRPKTKQNNLVYAINCQGENCEESYIGETKQPLHKRLYQHRRAGSAGNESAVYTHLSQSNHHFQDENVLILDKESRWFERGVKEAIYVNAENPSLNRGGGLRHNLSLAYTPIIRKLPRRVSNKTNNRDTDQ